MKAPASDPESPGHSCLHVGTLWMSVLLRPVLVRHGDRPRHGEHAGLRPRQGHRAERALGGGLSRQGRQEAGAGGGRGCQADAGPHPRQHRGDPPDARRRDRRLRRGGRDDQAFHPQGAQAHDLFEAQDHRLRAAWRDPGGKARDPPVGAVGRRAARRADRRTDRGGHRRGHADHRSDRQHGRRYRRRHHRSGGAVAWATSSMPARSASAATGWTRRSSAICAATRTC